MKLPKALPVIIGLAVAVAACEKDDSSATCRTLCDDKRQASLYDAEAHKCGVSDETIKEYVEKCRSDCVETLDVIVDAEYRSEAVDCLDCVHDEVKVEPTNAAMSYARGETCFPVCKEIGATQFFASFYITPPVWECPSE